MSPKIAINNFLINKFYFPLTENKKIKISKSNKNRVFLFGMPQHMNYGDLAIYVAEINFINKIIPNWEVVTIPERFIEKAIPRIQAVINPNDIVALHGGGNMGDIWPMVDNLRQSVLSQFYSYHIILFPQSISYSNEEWLKNTNSKLEKCSNIDLFARDRQSYNIIKNKFPKNVKEHLIPDIVFSLPFPSDQFRRDKKVLFLLRRDIEKKNDIRLTEIKQYAIQNYPVMFSDTVDDVWHIVTPKTIKKIVYTKLKQISKSSIVITDRLHGMIFSYITHTPAIVFDNNNHKIKNAYNTWLKGQNNILFVERKTNLSELKNFLREVKISNNKNEDFNFASLEKAFLD